MSLISNVREAVRYQTLRSVGSPILGWTMPIRGVGCVALSGVMPLVVHELMLSLVAQKKPRSDRSSGASDRQALFEAVHPIIDIALHFVLG